MNPKVYLITGATAGIGLVTARELARTGATVVGVGRNPEKSAAGARQIREATGNPNVEFLLADLSVQKDVRGLAQTFRQRYPRLDVLINNAGAVYLNRQESADGLELTFALNHLSYFLLTNLLLDMLKASAPARIVNVASRAHFRTPGLNFDDLQNRRGYFGLNVYNQSKLCNVLFTYELARRLAGTSVTVNTLHPGVVATHFFLNNGVLGQLARPLINLIAMRPADGAKTTLYLAAAPDVEGVTGKYFDHHQRETPSSKASYDQAAQLRLWRVSEQLTGLAG
jgi:NAD(P)-dependent dehydrogenase (short-subunit alcohol dehydrogenase family)